MATATTTTQSSLPAGYSASDLVFNDDFSGTTLDKDWHTYITSNAAKGAHGMATAAAEVTRVGTQPITIPQARSR